MSYQIDKKSGEITISGFEKGIAASPHMGIANIQNANISTDTGEVMCSYSRIQQSQLGTSAVTNHGINPNDASHLTSLFAINAGVWINITASTITNLLAGNNYYVLSVTGSAVMQLANFYNGAVISSFGLTGSATYSLVRGMGQPIAKATEFYSDGTTAQNRYYILDNQGLVWAYDTKVSGVTSGLTWFLPDFNLVAGASGIAVLNGWLHIFVSTLIFCKPTVNLGDSISSSSNWVAFAPGTMVTKNNHFAFVGHQGKLYYTDGNYLGSIFPNTSLLTGASNIQSYASYTGSSTTGTITTIISGTVPYNGVSNTTRIPAVFFHALTASGANPSGTTIGTIYYIKYLPSSSGFVDNSTFEVYAAASGGSALAIGDGVGTQYFVTYYPTSSGGATTITFTPQRLNLPMFETSQCMAELGSTILIGCAGNVMYPWNQIDPLPSDLIPLPENNVVNLVTTNNMIIIFAGSKGNIYITSGSVASLTLTIPDYCAGIAGTPQSYIEPYFIWGDAAFIRGRIYFSVLDQTASKAGNCGGIWSFIPINNALSIGQDLGQSLRLENQNSYGTYNGVATVILNAQNQVALSPQYWSGWYSSISNPTYGIDFTNTTPSTVSVIETELIETGDFFNKETKGQIIYQLSAPLLVGESVSIKYRQNSTAVFSTITNTLVTEGSTGLSGYYPVNFEKGQWLQLQITLTPVASSISSFVRLTRIIVK